MTTTTCPCCEARLLAEKANDVAQRALYDLHHTTVKGLQEALAAALAENERLRTERDGRKEQQFRVETAIVNAYMEVFPDWAYAGPEEAMRVFVRESGATTTLAEYESLLQSHTAQTRMIDAMEADLAALGQERDALRWAMDWDTLVGVVQGALCEFGTTDRMPDGTPVREHYNALARQIIEELNPRWQAVKGVNSTIVEHALAADQWKEQYQYEHKVCAVYRDKYSQDREEILGLRASNRRLLRAVTVLWGMVKNNSQGME